MLAILDEKQAEIAAVCREYGVARLEVFGSAMTDDFDPSRSDIDLIVRYHDDADLGYVLGRYFELIEHLANLLGRPVDLVMSDSGLMRDPFFRRFADPTRRVIFDALQDGETVERRREAMSSPGRE